MAPNATLELGMTEEERQLVLDTGLFPTALEAKLAAAPGEGESCSVSLTKPELEDFQGHVAAAANHIDDVESQGILDMLAERIEALLDV